MDLQRGGQHQLDVPPEVLRTVMIATEQPEAYPHIHRGEPVPAAQGRPRDNSRDETRGSCRGDAPALVISPVSTLQGSPQRP